MNRDTIARVAHDICLGHLNWFERVLSRHDGTHPASLRDATPEDVRERIMEALGRECRLADATVQAVHRQAIALCLTMLRAYPERWPLTSAWRMGASDTRWAGPVFAKDRGMMKPKTANTMKHRTTLEIEALPASYRWTVVLDHSTIVDSGTASSEYAAVLDGTLALCKATCPIPREKP